MNLSLFCLIGKTFDFDFEKNAWLLLEYYFFSVIVKYCKLLHAKRLNIDIILASSNAWSEVVSCCVHNVSVAESWEPGRGRC